MYCTQNRIYCGDCNQSVLPTKYPNHLKSQGHINNSLIKPVYQFNDNKNTYTL